MRTCSQTRSHFHFDVQANSQPQPGPTTSNLIRDGMLGLLIGDACGVPYEFRHPSELPAFEQLEMIPPQSFFRSYAHVAPGTWSDDGAQALCLYVSLKSCGFYHAYDFAARLIKWHDRGYMAVDNYVFDIGNQTGVAIARLKSGTTTRYAGLAGERNNGNGSLMRCLPLALMHSGSDSALVSDAHAQSQLTHAHLRSQVCCALFCLWVRREIDCVDQPWEAAVDKLRFLYQRWPAHLRELETQVLCDFQPKGTGYVLDTLYSARWACEGSDYRNIIQRALSLGHDTDTTASVAGGIAGVRHGLQNIPTNWRFDLRGQDILREIDLL